MSALLQWAFLLCAAMAAIGLCKLLMPSSNMEKTFRFVVSIFFLASLLTPVVIRFPNLMVEIPAHTQAQIDQRSQRIDELTRAQALEIARRNLRRSIAEKLSQRGINAHYIAINFTTGEQGEILLDSVDITLDQAHRQEEAELISYLQAELGSSVWLHYVGGNNNDIG